MQCAISQAGVAGYSGPFPFACLSGAFHSPGPQLGLRKGSIVPQNRPNHARSPHCQGCSEIPVRFLGIRSSAFTASRPPAPWLRLLMGNARISLFMKSLVATATGSSSSASKAAGDGIATCDRRDMCLLLSLKVF